MDFTRPIFQQKNLILCGHRGDRTGRDENTMAAFKRALGYGCDMIETDVRRTKDGVIILNHDSLIPGIGEIKDHTYEELKTVKPDLTMLTELAELAKQNPGLGLLIELKDVPPSAPGSDRAPVTHPAVYSGKLAACSGKILGPQDHKKIQPPKDHTAEKNRKPDPEGEQLALTCADQTAGILLENGLGNRVWILSFSGRLLEYVFKKYGDAFHYHAFYPWFVMGNMETDPADYCEMACMQHRYLSEDGFMSCYEDPLCPASWWEEVLAMQMVPIGAPSLNTDENYIQALEYGCGMINANDPVRIRELAAAAGRI